MRLVSSLVGFPIPWSEAGRKSQFRPQSRAGHGDAERAASRRAFVDDTSRTAADAATDRNSVPDIYRRMGVSRVFQETMLSRLGARSQRDAELLVWVVGLSGSRAVDPGQVCRPGVQVFRIDEGALAELSSNKTVLANLLTELRQADACRLSRSMYAVGDTSGRV